MYFIIIFLYSIKRINSYFDFYLSEDESNELYKIYKTIYYIKQNQFLRMESENYR